MAPFFVGGMLCFIVILSAAGKNEVNHLEL